MLHWLLGHAHCCHDLVTVRVTCMLGAYTCKGLRPPPSQALPTQKPLVLPTIEGVELLRHFPAKKPARTPRANCPRVYIFWVGPHEIAEGPLMRDLLHPLDGAHLQSNQIAKTLAPAININSILKIRQTVQKLHMYYAGYPRSSAHLRRV